MDIVFLSLVVSLRVPLKTRHALAPRMLSGVAMPMRARLLAHFRPFARPLSATIGCFLDDLFVDSARRGAGAADLLLNELGKSRARERLKRRAVDHRR